ncbi:MAG: hypothetical protein N2322_01220, partial [Terrimicrobiaceae bacterium]|nr:hypothetical protein [Terrimicrobiaceae bacterium]
MPELAAPYLGWMPLQPLPPGRTLRLDMRRFSNPGPGRVIAAKASEPPGAAVSVSGDILEVSVPPGISGLVRVPLAIRSEDGEELRRGILEVDASPRPGAAFRYEARGQAPARVTVAGTFNGWNTTSHPLIQTSPGIFELFVPAQPGILEYKFLVDGEWVADPSNPRRASNGNSVVEVAGSESPAPWVYAVGREQRAIRFEAPGAARLFALAQLPDGTSRPLEVSALPDARVSIEGLPEEAWVRVTPVDASGRCGPPARAPVGAADAFRWQDGIIYYAFTDRFVNGERANDAPVPDGKVLPPANYLGGDFEGIRQRIESGYFQSLGVNVLWLAPLNQNPEWSWQEFQE